MIRSRRITTFIGWQTPRSYICLLVKDQVCDPYVSVSRMHTSISFFFRQGMALLKGFHRPKALPGAFGASSNFFVLSLLERDYMAKIYVLGDVLNSGVPNFHQTSMRNDDKVCVKKFKVAILRKKVT